MSFSRLRLVIAALALAALAGCTAAPRADPFRPAHGIVVANWIGGTHHRIACAHGWWYQSFNDRLLVIDLATGDVRSSLALASPHATAPAIDLLVLGERMFVVLRDREVLTLDLSEPAQPRVIDRASANQLGISPRRVSFAGGEILVSGVGGVSRLDGTRAFASEHECGPVVMRNRDLITTIHRRIHRTSDGEYLGSASELIPMPLGARLPGSFLFVRRGDEQSQVGLMNDELRELDADRMTISFPSSFVRARLIDESIWLLTETDARAYAEREGELKLVEIIRQEGILDITRATENTLAVAGSFGRALFRERADAAGPGRTLFAQHREIGPITAAESDGLVVRVGGPLGNWQIHADGRWEPLLFAPRATAMPKHAATVLSQATIESERELHLRAATRDVIHREPRDARLLSITAVDARYWLGHERGLTILDSRADHLGETRATLEIGEPVRWIFPLLRGDGAFLVTEGRGAGVVRYEE